MATAILALLCPLYAQAIEQLPFIPTRFQLCVQELQDTSAEERESLLRQCLGARYRAERDIRSKCSQLVKKLKPLPRNADERYIARRQCFIDHLSASYLTLQPMQTAAQHRPASTAQSATAKLAAQAAEKAPPKSPAAE